MLERRNLFTKEHIDFSEKFQDFVKKEIAPFHSTWEKQGYVDKELFKKAGKQGFLCPSLDNSKNAKNDFKFNVIISEVLAKYGYNGVGFTLHSDVAAPLIFKYASTEQRNVLENDLISGNKILSLALTEASGGSDLANIKSYAEEKDDHYILNGTKKFIANGFINDLVIVAAKTDSLKGDRGISLFIVEHGTEGYKKKKIIKKIGLHARDIAELEFKNVKIPKQNLLGKKNRGFLYLMEIFKQERICIAVHAVASAQSLFHQTLEYIKERKVFGQSIGKHQSNQFAMAEMQTQLEISRVFVDKCIEDLISGHATQEQASMAKWWTTDLHEKVINRCLQLHGAYGFLEESVIGKAYIDNRMLSIYGGPNEVQKVIIAKTLGL